MLKQLTQLFFQLIESYFFVILLALGFGLLLPEKALTLTPYSTLLLQIIFFLTSIKLDVKQIIKDIKDIRMIVTGLVLMLIVFPIAIFYLSQILAPDLAIPLLLLAAMPTGMTAPLLAEIVGAKPGMAIIFTLFTSLLAPISVPFIIFLLARTSVSVNALTMAWSLVLVIVLPFLLAQIFRFFLHEKIKTTYYTFKPISIILLGLLIAGVSAKQADMLLVNFSFHVVRQLIVLFALLILLFLAGYLSIYWRDKRDRLTVAISLTFLNFTLAIYLASQFFEDPQVLLATILVIFPWTLLLIPFKYAVNKLHKEA